jgi:hypothetical protein
MIVFQYEPARNISGRAFIVVARIRLVWHERSGALFLTGDKQPVAVICRGEDGEEIFDVDGRRIDSAALQALLVSQSETPAQSSFSLDI